MGWDSSDEEGYEGCCRQWGKTVYLKAQRKGEKYGIPVELNEAQDAWGVKYEWGRELRQEK